MPMNLEVREQLIRCLQNKTSLKQFVKWFMPCFIDHALCNDDTPPLLATIQHALVEYSSGLIDEKRLRARLFIVASNVVEQSPAAVIASTVSTTMVVSAQPC